MVKVVELFCKTREQCAKDGEEGKRTRGINWVDSDAVSALLW